MTPATGTTGASVGALGRHYDVDDELFHLFLDEDRNYSCARWGTGDNLDAAQHRKLDRYAESLRIRAGASVLDVGCAWSGALRRFVSEHGARRAVGLTLNEAHFAYGRHLDGVDVRFEHWTDHQPSEPYDAIVNLESFEHFVHDGASDDERASTYRRYFERCAQWLVPAGAMALQVICCGDGVTPSARPGPVTDFIYDEIFPESSLPDFGAVAVALRAVLRDRRDRRRDARLRAHAARVVRATAWRAERCGVRRSRPVPTVPRCMRGRVPHRSGRALPCCSPPARCAAVRRRR